MSTCQALDEMIATTLGGPPDEQWTAISTASHDLRRAGRVLHAGSLLPKNVTCHVSRSTVVRDRCFGDDTGAVLPRSLQLNY